MVTRREFHITKLFVGSGEFDGHDPGIMDRITSSDAPFAGVLYPDGHVCIVEDVGIFKIILHMYQQQSGPLYASFEEKYPDGMIEVELLSGHHEYTGHRVPTAYPVPVDILWIDYDQFHHKLRVFKDRRQAYETHDEFELRRNELRPSHIIDLQICPYQVQFTTDDKLRATVLTVTDHLLA